MRQKRKIMLPWQQKSAHAQNAAGCVSDIVGQRKFGQAADLHPAFAHRNQHLAGGGVRHRQRHGGAAFAHHAVGHHNAQRPGDHVRPACIHNHGVFAGGSGAGAGLDHGAGGNGVGAHCQNLAGAAAGPQLFDQGTAEPAALTVDHNDFHAKTSLFLLLQQRCKQAQNQLGHPLGQRGLVGVLQEYLVAHTHALLQIGPHVLHHLAAIEGAAVLKMQIQAAVVHVGAANDGGFIVRHIHLGMDEAGGVFKDAHAGFQQAPGSSSGSPSTHTICPECRG